MNPTRRGFLAAIIAATAAPAIIKTAGLIMPIKPKLVDDPRAVLVTSVNEFNERAAMYVRGLDGYGKQVCEVISMADGNYYAGGRIKFKAIQDVRIATAEELGRALAMEREATVSVGVCQ